MRGVDASYVHLSGLIIRRRRRKKVRKKASEAREASEARQASEAREASFSMRKPRRPPVYQCVDCGLDTFAADEWFMV
jgi:hypothetical protein